MTTPSRSKSVVPTLFRHAGVASLLLCAATGAANAVDKDDVYQPSQFCSDVRKTEKRT